MLTADATLNERTDHECHRRQEHKRIGYEQDQKGDKIDDTAYALRENGQAEALFFLQLQLLSFVLVEPV